MKWFWVLCLWGLCGIFHQAAFAQETVNPASNEDEAGAPVGARPYEMDWANRTEPAHPQLVDFEDLTGWRVRCLDGAEAQLYRSKQELLFGAYTGKVVYSGANARSGFVIEPPQPIPIPNPFTAVDLWVRGNNWGWVEPPATARVGIKALVRDAKDEVYRIDLGVVDFDYWSLMHATCVSPDGTKRLYEPVGEPNDGVIDFPARFVGIEVTGCSSKAPARLYLDALSFYEMPYPPLTFEPAPEKLPWPTTPDTILPTVERSPQGTNACQTQPDGVESFDWPGISSNNQDSIRFTYAPRGGALSDLTASAGGQELQPCWKGGITFEIGGKRVRPGDADVKTTFLGKHDDAPTLIRNDWELEVGDAKVRYSYTIEMKHETCVIDVVAEGADAAQFDIGLAKGLKDPKTVFVPYLTYGDDWPKVVCSNGPEGPIFLLAILDYYNSDASELYGAPRLDDKEAVGYTGGAVYNPTTVGKRNLLRERLFITVSRGLESVRVLP